MAAIKEESIAAEELAERTAFTSSFLLQPKTVRITFWIVALLLGAAQTWSTRHDIFSDGISYIEIAKAYLRGDWSIAINSYWSPLYSWLLMATYWILRPSPYWEVATLHFVNFVAYCVSLGAAELLLAEMIRFRRARHIDEESILPDRVMLGAGYCTVLFAGLSLVNIWYCSPDMVAMALTLALAALLLRISYHPISWLLSLSIGVVCALSFLARTAFAPIFVICAAICAVQLYRSRQPWVRHLAIIVGTFLILCGPFIAAISAKQGRFTLGESGALNYGWEVDGAARYAHWQGEPGDIGKPKHPTKLVTSYPRSYTFATPVSGTYPPWFNPSYWYDGIKPRIKLESQLKVVLVNLSVLANLTVRSAIFICLVPLALLTGVRRWLKHFIAFWPILLPSLAVVSLYCLVYVEKRYIASNLTIVWLSALAGVRIANARLRRLAIPCVVVVCLAYTGIFVIRRQTKPVLSSVHDLVQHRETYKNMQYLIAERMKRLGLHAGDKIAYIGPAVDADWARLAGIKIVAEIPLIYLRNEKLLNNTLNDNARDIRDFWNDPGPGRAEALSAFVKAGARMLVTDGFYEGQYVAGWKRVLPQASDSMFDLDPTSPSQVNTRYVWLDSGSLNGLLARLGR